MIDISTAGCRLLNASYLRLVIYVAIETMFGRTEMGPHPMKSVDYSLFYDAHVTLPVFSDNQGALEFCVETTRGCLCGDPVIVHHSALHPFYSR